MIKAPSPLIDFSALTYQYVRTNVNFVAYYKDGRWDEGRFQAEDTVDISVLSTGIHYGQQAFEGMKAYRTKSGKVQLFRPQENAKRFQHSCERVMMPQVPIDMFLNAITKCVELNSEFVPPYASKATLYVRPYMIGIGPNLVLAPAKEFLFGVITMPVGLFFKSGLTPANFTIADYDRAAPKGTGDVKVGGNYAASMYPNYLAKSRGFTDCIYLDPITHTKIDEGGAANFFGITKTGVFVTPKSASILPSITKLSLLTIAKDYLHLPVLETDIYVSKLDELAEAATCGTAAIITPIGTLEDHGKTILFGVQGQVGPITKQIYDVLTGIQFGDIPPPEGWIHVIE
jgi:branched-chain amino acid aminotransferase